MPPDEVVDVAQNAQNDQEPGVLADSKLPKAPEDPVPNADVKEAAAPDDHEDSNVGEEADLLVQVQSLVK